jgi:hypothetical protein
VAEVAETVEAEGPLADVVEEARRLVELAAAEDLSLRVLGGVGVALRCPGPAARPDLRRDYGDIDLAAHRRDGRRIREVLEARGYVSHKRFNALRGSTRLLFFDEANDRQVDVFLSVFEMCQTLDIDSRLDFPGPACTASDLLLTKLQIVELNEKDILDSAVLLLGAELVDEDGAEAISREYVGRLCGGDWGWSITLGDNLPRVAEAATRLLSDAADAELLRERADGLVSAIDAAPRTLRWRLRNRIGRRKIWYELPEEVDR